MIPSRFVASEGIDSEAQRNLMLQKMMEHERVSVQVSFSVTVVVYGLEKKVM